MGKTFKLKTVLCGAICLAASQAFAGTYAVPGQYATIQAAINAASDNSIINVAPGIYNENLNFGTRMMLQVVATGGAAATIIDGGNAAPIITVGNNTKMPNMPVVMNGFTLQNGYNAITGGVTTLATGSTLTITNCIVKNNQAGSGAAFAVSGGILKINNSVISNNTAISAGGAFYVTSGSTTLTNNTIVANVAADGASINQLYGAGIGGANNIIYGNLNTDGTASYPVINGPVTATFTYSDIEGGIAGTGNINADPMFVNAAADNFQLATGSPAIDTAQTAAATQDILGVVRPQGAAPDMGAYEYVTPVLPPVNGTCGTSNGAILTVAPTANLCTDGTASTVTGTGPFDWTCAGNNGGTTSSCTAQLQVVTPPADVTPPTAVSFVTSGTSGASATISVTFSEAVAATKSLGTIVKIGTLNTAVTVSGSVATIKLMSCCVALLKPGIEYTLTIPAGSFRDAAGNLNALITAPVTFGTAPVPVNGTCGTSNGGIFTVAPTANLCSTGTASAVTGSGPFAWTCDGSNGGTAASCSAQLQVVPPADVTPPTFSSIVVNDRVVTITFSEQVTAAKPATNLGGRDLAFTSVSGSTATFQIKSCCSTLSAGVTYTLTIPAGAFKDAAGNLNPAVSVSVTPITLPAVNGACGSSNGGIFTIAPTANLCTTGTASAVTGVGPFAWACDGSNGGTAASCSAQLQVVPPADVTPPTAVSFVPGGTSGYNATITVTFSENVLMTKPLGTIVKIGTLNTAVTGSGSVFSIKLMSCCISKLVPGTGYILTIPAGSFRDSAGNLNALITAPVTFGSAPVPVNGTCGSANGAIFTVVPSANLCAAGTASAVSGAGPFAWTCVGSNGGTTANCAATLQPPVVDVTPPAVASVAVAKGSNVAADIITVTFSESVTSTKYLGKIMHIGTADTTYNVSGATVTIKVMKCCLNKVKTGRTYNLIIPAGSFKDAAGNLNTAISVPVTL